MLRHVRAVIHGSGNRGAEAGAGWDVSTAVYTGKSKLVSAEETTTYDVTFNDDGTKMYVIGSIQDRVFQYTLGTAWDLGGTVDYSGKSAFIRNQETNPFGVTFSVDGTNMYVTGDTEKVFQYTLGAAWDVSTATYASKLKDVTTEVDIARAVHFSTDGTKMYIASQGDEKVYQYTLGTAWDLGGTVTYANKFGDVSGETGGVAGVTFNGDGTQMFLVSQTTDSIVQYTVGTAWDVSTIVYAEKFKDVSDEDTAPTGLYFSPDGTNMYTVGWFNDTVYQYTLS
jgi:sugar lactone lactonase YvrE